MVCSHFAVQKAGQQLIRDNCGTQQWAHLTADRQRVALFGILARKAYQNAVAINVCDRGQSGAQFWRVSLPHQCRFGGGRAAHSAGGLWIHIKNAEKNAENLDRCCEISASISASNWLI